MKMDKILLFSIAVVFCVAIFITSAKEVNENDGIISGIEITNHIPEDTSVNKVLEFNEPDLKIAREDECKCTNGKCMRVCDAKKTTPCTDERMVCVCNPEFSNISDDECQYCDCEQGNNCTFRKSVFGALKKICFCPEGYFDASSKCRPECNDERPCQNGGTCGWYKRCFCHSTDQIKGYLCEEIVECSSKCTNRLEVDCLYDQHESVVYCSCKNSSLYYDQEARICKPCTCENGYCDYRFSSFDRELFCHCHHGYKEFNGYCKECDCGSGADGQCQFDSKGEKICKCIDGFYERGGRCRICGCKGWSDMDTKCEVTGNVKRCFCKEGFKDVLGHCEDINECEENNTCHLSTTCYNTFGSFYCECPEGYRGSDGRKVEPGEVCEDINECEESSIPCWIYDHVKCVNVPGSFKCECRQGYEPRSYSLKPHATTCVEATSNQGPVTIVVLTTLIIFGVSLRQHVRLRNRAIRTSIRSN